MPGHRNGTKKRKSCSSHGGTRKQRGGFGFLKKLTKKATDKITEAAKAAPVLASTIVPTNVSRKGLMDDLEKKKKAALSVINSHRQNAINATQNKKKQIAEKLGKMAAHHEKKADEGHIISYGTPGEPDFSQESSWIKGQKSRMHNHIAKVATKVGMSVHREAFNKGFTGANQEPLTKGGKRKHKRKSNKHKHKKRHATKKRGHKKHGHKKRHATKKRGHKKRKQRGGNCGCELS